MNINDNVDSKRIYEDRLINKAVRKLIFGNTLEKNSPINETLGEELKKTYKLFLCIKEQMYLGNNILIIDRDFRQLLARFISTYQCFLQNGTVTIYSRILYPKSLGKIKVEDKELRSDEDDHKHFDSIISRNPCERLDDVLGLSVKQGCDFFIETCYPWGLEYIQPNYQFDVYDLDTEFLYASFMDKVHKSFSEDVVLNYPETECNVAHLVRSKKIRSNSGRNS